jgi:hypothetical protein
MAAVMRPTGENDTASRRLQALLSSPEFDTYPNRTHFIGADNPRQDEMATRALLEGEPVLLVYPDGHELLIRPEPSGGARLETRHPPVEPVAA